MLVALSLIAALGTNLLCLRIDWRAESPFSFIWGLSFIFLFLPLFAYWLQGDVPERHLLEAFLFMAVCNILYILTLIAFVRRGGSGPKKVNLDYGPTKRRDTAILLGCLLIPLLLAANGLNIRTLLESTLADKRALSFWYLAILIICCYVFPQLIYAWINRKKFLIVVLLFVFALVALYFRSRSLLAVLLMPIAYYVLFRVKNRSFWVIGVGVVAFGAAQLLKVIRYQGSLEAGLDVSSWGDSLDYVLSNNLGSGDLSIASYFINVVADCSPALSCGDWTLLTKALSKLGIVDFAGSTIEYRLYDYYVESGVNGSLHPTGYGFAYADGGRFWGALYFPLLALLRLSIHRVLLHSRRNYIYMGFIMYFVMFFSRGSVYNSLALLAVAFAIELIFRGCDASLRRNKPMPSALEAG